jgi:putative two-component system response regulator
MIASAKHRLLAGKRNGSHSEPVEASEVLRRIRSRPHTRLLQLELNGHDLDRAHEEILERLARAAELRDDDSGQHTRRVAEISARIAASLGLSSREIDLLRRAAPLHDVGKSAIPDNIMIKQGNLSAAEVALIQSHTTVGASMLSNGKSEVLAVARDIAEGHHERWDGSGYPHALRGNSIPLMARIVAVADCFDALSHARPYRTAWPMGRVISEIRKGAGTRFDAKVVDAFLRAF